MKRLLVIGFLLFLDSCSQLNVQSNILLNGEQEVTVMIDEVIPRDDRK